MCKKSIQHTVILVKAESLEGVINQLLYLSGKLKCGSGYFSEWRFYVDDSKFSSERLIRIVGENEKGDHWVTYNIIPKSLGYQVSFWMCDCGTAKKLIECILQSLGV